MKFLDETTIKYTETGGTYSYPNWLFGCSACVTEPNSTQQLRYVGQSIENSIWNDLTVMISTRKFLFAFWVIRASKCVVVIFPKFELAGIPVRPFEYLDVAILIIACAPCSRMRDAHAQHDITRFASCTNNVTMTSPAFGFHSCHIGMRWYGVISVRVVGTPCNYGSHRMGMMLA